MNLKASSMLTVTNVMLYRKETMSPQHTLPSVHIDGSVSKCHFCGSEQTNYSF
jgi:hypothetical protein